MSERRRGLGRGLGALIPTSGDRDRPVDVFFPSTIATSPPADEAQTDGDGAGSVATLTRTDEDATDVDGGLGADTGGVSVGSGPVDAGDDADGKLTVGEAAARAGESESAPEGEPAASPVDASAAKADELPTDSSTAEDRPDDRASGTESTAVSTGESAGVTSVTSASNDDGRAIGGATDVEAAADEAVSRETTQPPEMVRPQDARDGVPELVPVPGATFAELPVESIHPNARQPRSVFDEHELDELIGSIREIGVLQPVVVRRDPEDQSGYELIMGERRWRATQAAGLTHIPAIIRETDDADMLRDALLENLHRSALNPLEEAAAYRQLLDDFGCTHEELATRISRSRPQISNTLRLLRLPPLVQRRVAAGVLSAGHARALLGLSDGAAIERLAQRIVAEGLSVRATEEIVSMGGLDQPRAARTPRAGQRSGAIEDLSTRLSDRFETRVRVSLGKSKGRLTVEFASVEDLNRILDKMAPEDPGLLREQPSA